MLMPPVVGYGYFLESSSGVPMSHLEVMLGDQMP